MNIPPGTKYPPAPDLTEHYLDMLSRATDSVQRAQGMLDKVRREAVESLCPYKPGTLVKTQYYGGTLGSVEEVHYYAGNPGSTQHRVYVKVRLYKRDGLLGNRTIDTVVSITGDDDFARRTLEIQE